MERNIFGEDELYQLVFVSCFSTEKVESIPMWSIYGKDENGLFPLNWINPILSKTYWISKAKQYHQANILLLDMEK